MRADIAQGPDGTSKGFGTVLLGSTREAAKAIGQSAERGTLEVGKLADLAVWDVESPCELAYYLGLNQLHRVYRRGVERTAV